VHIDDKAVSRKHAALTIRDQQARALSCTHTLHTSTRRTASFCFHVRASLRLTLSARAPPRAPHPHRCRRC
jgi:hypothetical protein